MLNHYGPESCNFQVLKLKSREAIRKTQKIDIIKQTELFAWPSLFVC